MILDVDRPWPRRTGSACSASLVCDDSGGGEAFISVYPVTRGPPKDSLRIGFQARQKLPQAFSVNEFRGMN